MEIDVKQLSDILREYILEKQKLNPSLSRAQLAQKVGIPESTFNRIVNSYTQPSLTNLSKLYQYIPQIQTFVKNCITKISERNPTSEYVGDEMESLLGNQYLFITYALAISHRGITEKEIMYCLGYSGKKALHILLEKRLIKKSDNNVYRATNEKKGMTLSFEVFKKHSMALIERYQIDNFGRNYIYYVTESLNEEGLKKLRAIYRETHRKVQKLMEKQENKGNIPVFAGGYCDMFCIEECNEKGGKQ